MICPRCGVINTDAAERCTRCRGSLAPAPEVGADGAAPAGEQQPAPVARSQPQPPQPLQPLPPPPPVPTPVWAPQSVQWPAPPSAPSSGPAVAPPPWSAEGRDRSPPGPAGGGAWQPPPPPPGWRPPSEPGRPPWNTPQPAWPGPGDDRAWKPGASLPTYLPWAVICTILLFPIGGIVAIVYGLMVNRRLASGDWEGASRASRLARTWCLISVGIAGLVLIGLITGVVKNPYASH